MAANINTYWIMIQPVKAEMPKATGGVLVIVETRRVVRDRNRVTRRDIRPGITFDETLLVKKTKNQKLILDLVYLRTYEEGGPRCNHAQGTRNVVYEHVASPSSCQDKNESSLRPGVGGVVDSVEVIQNIHIFLITEVIG